MLMRYHWGLAIGHVYSHGQAASITPVSTEAIATASTNDTEPETSAESEVHQSPHRLDPENNPDVDDAEFGFQNREDDFGDEEEGSGLDVYTEDEEDLMASRSDDMYGFDDLDDYH